MLLTLAKLKTHLGISNTNDDTALTDVITGVGKRFEQFCDRDLERAADQVENHDSLGVISLRRFPVEAATINYDLQRIFAVATVQTADIDYVLDARTGLLRFLFNPEPYPLGVKATVTGGYVSAGGTPGSGQTAIPDDITRAMIRQCEFEWRNHTEFGRTSVSLAGQSISGGEFELLPEVKATLQNHKRISI